MKGNKQVPFRLIPRRGRERRGEDGRREGDKGDGTKMESYIVTLHSSPLSFYCERSGETLSSIPVFVYFQFHPPFPCILSLSYQDGQFIFRKQISEHQIFGCENQPCNSVPFCMLMDEVVCVVCPSRVPRLCAKRALSK